MTLLKKLVLLSIACIALGMLGLFAGAHFFEEEIIAKVKSSINEQVDTRIDVEALDFSLIQDFPQASILFQGVLIADNLNQKDTLLISKTLSLRFDIWDLVNENYTIDEVSVRDGRINMLTDKNGNVNYAFWKEKEDSETEISFAIEKLELEDIEYSYHDIPADLSVSSFIGRASMKGEFQEGWMDMQVDVQGEQTYLLIEEAHYLQNNPIAFQGDVKVSQEGDDILLEDAVAEVGELKIPLFGRINKEGHWNVDLDLEGKADIAEFLAQLPKDQKGSIDELSPKGQVEYHLTLKGASSYEFHPAVNMDFNLRKGGFQIKEDGSNISRVNATGTYSRNSKGLDKVMLSTFQAEVEQGSVSFVGTITDFYRPNVTGRFGCEAELTELLALAGQTEISNANGNVNITMEMDGVLPTEELTDTSLNNMNLLGKAELQEVSFSINSVGYQVSDLTSDLVLKDDILLFEHLEMLVNTDSVSIKGSLSGLWGFLLSDVRGLKLDADIEAPHIHWDNWIGRAKSSDGEEPSALPEQVSIDLSFALGAFTYGMFKAEDLKGFLNSNGRTLELNPMSMKSCNGALTAELKMTQLNDLSWELDTKGDLRGMEVTEIFRQFDQFGQDFITDEHIKGNGDARISFSANLSTYMEVDSKSILADADITIDNGQLVEHPSMVNIIDAMRERHLLKPFVRADELEQEMHRLVFQQLRNSIHIENGQISIPEMRIANNAMDLGIAGIHGFNQEIDYTIDFSLRDILVNKSNPEFLIQDDGLGHIIHLRMHGTADDPIIELDKRAVKENRREAIAQAKDDVKEFLKNPFKKKEPTKEKDERAAVVVEVEGANKKEEAKRIESEPKEEKKKWWHVVKDDVEEEEIVPLDDEDDF